MNNAFARRDLQIMPQQRLIASEEQARRALLPDHPRLAYLYGEHQDIQPQQREAGLHMGSSPSCNCSQTTLEPVVILSLLSPRWGGL